MRQILPSFGIAAALMFAGCPTPPNNNGQDTCVDDASICGAGTVCEPATETCVAENCINTENPNFCDAGEVCNANGQCEEEVLIQNCTSLDGSTTVQPNSIDVEIPGDTAVTAVLTDVQFGIEGDSADTVFQINLPEDSDLIIQTEVANGQIAQDTVLTLRSATCDGNVVATADNVNSDNGAAAILSARSLPAGEYFLFVDSKTTAPINEAVQLRVSRVEIVGAGLGCVAGAGTERCADGLTCLSPVASGNVESFNSCEPFSIDDTRVFLTDDTGKIYEINPANGVVLNEGDITTPSGQLIPISGTGHYALAYDDVGNRIFWHDNASTQSDDDVADGVVDGLRPEIKKEVIIFDADTLTRTGQWGTANIGNNNLGQPFAIEGLAFNSSNPNEAQRLSAFDASAGEVTVVDPNNGNFGFDYPQEAETIALFAGFGVDAISTEPSFGTAGRGYVSVSTNNQLQEFRLGVGTFLRTVAAPPQIGTQCGVGSRGNFAFVGYTDGLVRVFSTVANVFPNLPEGSFITEYRAPGFNACGLDAGGL